MTRFSKNRHGALARSAGRARVILMNLMKQAIQSGKDIDLLRLLAAYDRDGVIPALAPIFDAQRKRCIRKGWARSVVTGTEITAKGLEVLRAA